MQTTKSHILDILKRSRGATVDELASALSLAPATVRRHLDILQRDGTVTFHEVRRETGRPHYVFTLTEQGEELFPKGYSRLTSMILHEIASLRREDVADKDGGSLLRVVFERLADRLVEQYAPRFEGRSYEERAGEMVQILNEEGFLSTWEKTPEGYKIVGYSCPHLRAAEANGEVCTLDLALIRKVMGDEVIRLERQAEGAQNCIYALRARRN